MGLIEYIIFGVFIVLNSYFSFRAGETSGKFGGIISIVQFLKDKNALKDKNSIEGFNQWPALVKEVYNNPYEIESD
ncbi:MAG: hypothetical protein ACKVJK_19795 [Methylophagaceae bacterium]|jgi:hypothetical protein|tara:strand:+ start:504 stop:731 length:228 start_codon:yes stop_codon:yes gene_type:complete